MTASATDRSLERVYVLAQICGWGLFLVLRIALTTAYCAKTPQIPLVSALVLETVSHLACAAWSHVVWRWLNRRRLVERGWRRVSAEGTLVASIGVAVVFAGTWQPYTTIYGVDFARFGDSAMFWLFVVQHAMTTALWFWALVALLFFGHAQRLAIERTEARAAAREAQLHALRGQVNPHFLFNSFNSLRALIALDPNRAAEALTQLSVLLRYSLSGSDRLVVPLAEELHVVRLYLELEKLRLGPRLRVVAEAPAEPEGAMIPPLILQNLVENAVKYGPAALKAGGEVAYSVTLTGGRLHVRVANPGSLAAASDSTGIGLRNLRERLHLLFGDDAAFTLREEAGGLVVAEASLPARPPVPAPPHESAAD